MLRQIARRLHLAPSPPQETAEERERRKAASKARKAAARLEAFRSGRWQHGEISRRNYGSYDEYLEHQAAKLDRIDERLKGQEERSFATFRARFEAAPEIAGPVLCLGARLGTEVRAFHSLGHFAVGIDLNPGDTNKFVLPGDFHALQFPDASVATVYCNVLDHVFDLDRFAAEVRRVLRPGGVFLVDALNGYEEGFVAGEFEAMHWPRVRPFLEAVAKAGGFTLERVTRVDEPWNQAVLRLH